jgi:hypothetical protein
MKSVKQESRDFSRERFKFKKYLSHLKKILTLAIIGCAQNEVKRFNAYSAY